jgi:N-acetylmuramoyl-L-alanine amidase
VSAGQPRSPNWDPRPAGGAVDILVLHYTGMKSAADALARLCDPAARVSAHYLIDEDGAVHALVDEARRAWHAGVAFWRGQHDVNARSIGIELANPGHEHGYCEFPSAQMAALESLALEILARHAIPPRNVVGHSDVAPRRKQDPGELFEWRRLAARGIGLWPVAAAAAALPAIDAAWDAQAGPLLARYGYESDDVRASVRAFQRHFRPALITGVADAETVALLLALLEAAEGRAIV